MSVQLHSKQQQEHKNKNSNNKNNNNNNNNDNSSNNNNFDLLNIISRHLTDYILNNSNLKQLPQ